MKVLLTLLDGMRPDALTACGSEFANGLLQNTGTYTLTATTVMPSVTLPCHMSLFHSVPPERHGIVTNIFTPQVRPVQGICERVRAAGKKAALFYDWGELRDLAQPDSLDFGMYISGHTNGFAQAQAKLKETVKSYIRESSPDFVFFYLGLPDEIGHAKGWMKEDYMKAVHDSMETVGEVAGTLPDDYITIITADHGGHGCTHGTDLPEDMTIPILFHGKNLPPIDFGSASILDIAPTAAKLVGFECATEWQGRSLV